MSPNNHGLFKCVVGCFGTPYAFLEKPHVYFADSKDQFSKKTSRPVEWVFALIREEKTSALIF